MSGRRPALYSLSAWSGFTVYAWSLPDYGSATLKLYRYLYSIICLNSFTLTKTTANMKKKVLVCGGGGFIGGHLIKRLKREGFWVRGCDLKYNEYAESPADEFVIGDLRDPVVVRKVVEGIDEIYQLAAD